MTADVSSLIEKAQRHARALHDAALADLLDDLDQRVPDHDLGPYAGLPGTSATSPKLRDTRRVSTTEFADRIVTSISYSLILNGGEDLAELLEDGTSAHPISSVPASGSPPLAFYWPKLPGGAGWVFTTEVNHPGSVVHRDWFSGAIVQWPNRLADALGGLPLAA